MRLEEMRQRVSTFADKECGRGATEAEVAAAESSLGNSFPKSYRHFLRCFGWARFSHEELYGIGSDVPTGLNLVRNALAERQEMAPAMPRYLVPVMNDGAGNHYCLDTGSLATGECPIVFWDHEQGGEQKPQFIAESFDVWLLELLQMLAKGL